MIPVRRRALATPTFEEKKLRGGDRFPLVGVLIRRQLIPDRRVFENLVVLAHRARRQADVGRDRGAVDLPLGEPGHIQEATEVADRTGQALGLNLLAPRRPI